MRGYLIVSYDSIVDEGIYPYASSSMLMGNVNMNSCVGIFPSGHHLWFGIIIPL